MSWWVIVLILGGIAAAFIGLSAWVWGGTYGAAIGNLAVQAKTGSSSQEEVSRG